MIWMVKIIMEVGLGKLFWFQEKFG